MDNEASDVIENGVPTSISRQRRRTTLARFGSLSFINDYRVASEMLAGNEKLLKQAFFNAAANIFVLLAVLASIAVFYVLELFLRPLLWATLTGSFLYPFKKAATGSVQNWLDCLSDSGTPLFIGLLLLPFNTVNYLADRIGHFVSKKFYLFIAIIFAYPLLYIIFTYTPIKFLFYAICSIVNLIFTLHGYFVRLWLKVVAPYFWTLFIAYCIIVLLYARKENYSKFKKSSLAAWILMSYNLFLTSSSLVVLVMTVVSLVMLTGYFLKIMSKIKQKQKTSVECQQVPLSSSLNRPSSEPASEHQKLEETINEPSSVPTVNSEEATEEETCEANSQWSSSGGQIAQIASFLKSCGQQIFDADNAKRKSSTRRDQRSPAAKTSVGQKVERNFNDLVVSYGFYSLGWAIVTIQALKHLWILPALLLPLTIFILKRAFVILGIDVILAPYMKIAKDKFTEVQDVLLPTEIQKLIQYYLEGDRKVIKALQGSIGIVVSVLLVLLLLLGCLIMSFFLAAQIQQEGMAVVEMGTTLAQEMTSSYPQFKSIMPNNTDIQASLTMVVERAYDYSRDLIEKWITTYLVVEEGEQADKKSQQITDQLLAIYDQLYLQLWVKRNETSNQTMADVLSSMQSLYSEGETGDATDSSRFGLSLTSSDGIMKALKTHGADWFYSGYDVIHGNFDTLRSVAISVWAILRSNLSLIANVVTSLIWVILSSGSHIMNFLISIVVFLTALFYLLSLSGNRYKPMEIIASIMPSATDANSSKSLPPQNRFAEAVNSAVMGVFGASLKLSSFYGLLTYVTHTIAGVRLVFLPAAVAAILGAVPVFGTYLACIPAFLELWLLHDQLLGAFLLLSAHLLPTYGGFDTAIYGQISGAGHPYLTGLAVVGGISIKGLEGAILGPLLLCLLIVVSNMYTTMIAGETDPPSFDKDRLTPDPDVDHYASTGPISSKRRPPELRTMRSRSMVGVENLEPYSDRSDVTQDATF